MSISKILYIILFIYSIITLSLLIKYTDQQYNDALNISATDISVARLTIGYNICILALFLIGSSFVYNIDMGLFSMNLADHDENTWDRYRLYLWLMIPLSIISLILLGSSFGVHCYYRTCLTSENPLYIMVLIGILILCLFTVMFFGWLFFGNLCEIKKESYTEPILTYDIIQKLCTQKNTTQCDICTKQFNEHANITLLPCGHYFHIKCYKKNIKCINCN
ncbi:MAG: hypothetical protein Edafosvirus9_27 [Edafosvirus sp.]|uniref:RING-type domain-containing protein n=1 Tax=Edafosvirus sp. TaxID=2487765 RepID=A0A3G4ZXJ2_9VIRU|nr:MAG: hypothetical protein Edafosvirus9_27 [Edafosvirus sp.]